MVLSTCMQAHANNAKIHVKKLQMVNTMEASISMFNIGVVGWMSFLVGGYYMPPHTCIYVDMPKSLKIK